MKKGISLFLGVLLLVMNTVFVTYAQEPETLHAQSAVLMDADSGRVLYAKNADQVRAMASTTKIMTCILALEKSSPDTIVTASKEAARQPKVHLGMQEGEQFYLKDLLYSLMLESHNDSAVAIAEAVAGDVASFAAMMNEKAKSLGCDNTHFVTPNGIDGEDEGGIHSTTAADLARIMKYCIGESPKTEEFLAVTQAADYAFADVERKRQFHCTNHNAFLGMMEGALSGKTGFTADAGYCYVGALRQGEKTFIVALLACGWPNNKGYKWADTRKLMEYGLANYEYREFQENHTVEPVFVKEGVKASGRIGERVYVPLWIQKKEEPKAVLLKEGEAVRRDIFIKENVQAPVKKGQIMGKEVYSLDGKVILQNDIVAEEAVEQRDLRWCFEKAAEILLMKGPIV